MDCYPFSPAKLPYSSLAPEISDYTLCFHYDGHYTDYCNKLNSLIEASPTLKSVPLKQLLKSSCEDIRFNAGGVFNHRLYFMSLTPDGTPLPYELQCAFNADFGSFCEFEKCFKKTASELRGSGYVWLCADCCGHLRIGTTANQNTPDTTRLRPLLCCDMWEHAYYLDRQNRKKEYIDAFFKLIDWNAVCERMKAR